jgi:hypothetical protein
MITKILNFNLALLIVLVLLMYLIRKKFLKNIPEVGDLNSPTIFKFLDRYRIRNLYLSIINTFIYICSNFIFFILLRFLYLGNTQDLSKLNINDYLTFINIFYVILYIILVYNIFRLVKELCFVHVIRLLIRFLYYYPNIIEKIKDFSCIIQNKLDIICVLLSYTTNEYIRLRRDKEMRDPLNIALMGSLYKLQVIIYNLASQYKVIMSFVIYLDEIIHWVRVYKQEFLESIQYILLISTLMYDLSHKQIYYSYYGMFIFLCIAFFYRLIIFCWNIEESSNNLLRGYFYDGPYTADYNVDNLRKEEIRKKGEDATKNELEELSTLIQVELKRFELSFNMDTIVSYLIDNLEQGKSTLHHAYSYHFSDRHRIWVIRKFMCLCFTIYSLYYIFVVKKITLYLMALNLTINSTILFIIFSSVLIIFWSKNTHKRVLEGHRYINVPIKSNNPYMYSFWFSTIVINLLFIYLTFHNNLFHGELSLNIFDWIILKENITITEKITFFFEYLKYIWLPYENNGSFTYLTLSYVTEKLQEVGLERFIDCNTTLAEIKNRIEIITGESFNLNNLYQTTRIDLVKCAGIPEFSLYPNPWWLHQMLVIGSLIAIDQSFSYLTELFKTAYAIYKNDPKIFYNTYDLVVKIIFKR